MDMYEIAKQDAIRNNYAGKATDSGFNTDNRLNQLRKYMDFYNTSGMRPNRAGTLNAGDLAGADNQNAMNWAQSQLDGPRYQPQPAPNFYGEQPQFPQQPQYVQPNFQQQENPFTNYLKRLMEGGRGNGQMTPGVRG